MERTYLNMTRTMRPGAQNAKLFGAFGVLVATPRVGLILCAAAAQIIVTSSKKMSYR
jgi:hypothetical protein